MSSFHGKNKKHTYFEGWYLKHQNTSDTVAFIPAFHINEEGYAQASLQIITNEISCNINFPSHKFLANPGRFFVRLGDCIFSEHGCKITIKTKDLEIRGRLKYGPFTPPCYDIMGPFRFAPFMECRHSVFSLHHRVYGTLMINGKKFRFHNSAGYMEGDRGISFPQRYLWTQCSWDNNCVMLSIADIPFWNSSFIGCVGFVYLNGKEYRIATYLGVKLLHVSERAVYLKQGRLTLRAELLEFYPHPLHAPQLGNMIRTIHESPSCHVHYTCSVKNLTLFDFVSEQASFENNWIRD